MYIDKKLSHKNQVMCYLEEVLCDFLTNTPVTACVGCKINGKCVPMICMIV